MWFDVAIVGAGLAGLTCAKSLQNQGYRVVIVEKSKGVGGRVATRRLQETCADHGLPAWISQGILTQQLLEQLSLEQLIQPWQGNTYRFQSGQGLTPIKGTDTYIHPEGMTTIAKFLARDLTIYHDFRLRKLELIDSHLWQLLGSQEIMAKVVVLAIPAPQAWEILADSPWELSFLADLKAVEFDPCLVAISGYPPTHQRELDAFDPHLKSMEWADHPLLKQIILDSSKRSPPGPLVFVAHSSPTFAQTHLDNSHLEAPALELLRGFAQDTWEWIAEPDWMQVHRWRFCFPRTPLTVPYLATLTPLPLVCCGDWCGGNSVESALKSGTEAANWLTTSLV